MQSEDDHSTPGIPDEPEAAWADRAADYLATKIASDAIDTYLTHAGDAFVSVIAEVIAEEDIDHDELRAKVAAAIRASIVQYLANLIGERDQLRKDAAELRRYVADLEVALEESEADYDRLEAAIATGLDEVGLARIKKNVGNDNTRLRERVRELEAEVANLTSILNCAEIPETVANLERYQRERAERERDEAIAALERATAMLEKNR